MSNIACPDALFVYSPDDERDAMLTAAGFPAKATASVVAVGNLHMLRWPKLAKSAQRLLSRCTDGDVADRDNLHDARSRAVQ